MLRHKLQNSGPRKRSYVPDLEVWERGNESNLEIRECVHHLPFSRCISEGIDNLHPKVFKSIDDLHFEALERLDNLKFT